MNKTARVQYADRRMLISTPFDPDFVNELKARLKTRKWDPRQKVWTVDIKERPAALELLKGTFDVVEENSPEGGDRGKGSAALVTVADLDQTAVTAEWLSAGELEIWTDGACSGNPGPGGYGIIFKRNKQIRAQSGGFNRTTNNRMELLAAIAALEMLPAGTRVVLYSDSQYLVDAVNKGWAVKWRANGWKRNSKDRALNPDLWERLLNLTARLKVEFRWVRGHAQQTENEWCDQLAVAAAARPGLPVDTGYTGTPETRTSDKSTLF